MTSTLLSKKEHSDLLEKVSSLSKDKQVAVYKENLEELFDRYNNQIIDLFVTISDYERIATIIRLLQSMQEN